MKKKKDETLIQKLLNALKRKPEDEELKKLKDLKKRIKEIKTVEELEALEGELDEIGIALNPDAIDRLKKKKKKKLERQNQSFQERIRCDLETINKIIEIGRAHKQQERQKEYEELLQVREERQKNGGQKDKEKSKSKGRDDRTSRSSGGRSRDSR